MKDFSKYDLISAYLDGEVTAAERAEVEQLLAESPEARQLLEEFRALGSTLQNLPPRALDEDLTERVLQKAERRMLAEPAGKNATGVEPVEELPPWRVVVRRVLNPRSLTWSGMAVAVALLLMFMDRQAADRPAGERVAMVREEAEPKAAPRMRAAPSIKAVEAVDEAVVLEALAEPASAAAPSAPPPAAFAAKKAPPTRKPLGKTAPADMLADQPTDRATAKTEAPGAAPGRAARAKAPGPGLAAKGVRPQETGRRTNEAALTKSQKSQASPRPEPVLLVYCDISAEAAREKRFDQVLVNHGIARAEKAKADDEALRRGLAGADDFRRKSGKQFGLGQFERDRGETGPLDVVYVEASPEKIQATLSALKADPQAFSSVSTSTRQSEGGLLDGLWSRAESKIAEAETPRQRAEIQQKAPAEESETERSGGRAIRLGVPARGAAGLPPREAKPPGDLARQVAPRAVQQALETPAVTRVLFVLRVVDAQTPSAAASSSEPAKSADGNKKPATAKP